MNYIVYALKHAFIGIKSILLGLCVISVYIITGAIDYGVNAVLTVCQCWIVIWQGRVSWDSIFFALPEHLVPLPHFDIEHLSSFWESFNLSCIEQSLTSWVSV